MKKINNRKRISFDNLEESIEERISLFKILIDNINPNNQNLKDLGNEIVDSKIMLELLKNNLKNKPAKLDELISALSRDVNRYSEFEKILRKQNYFVNYKIVYILDKNDNICSLNIYDSTESEQTNFNQLISDTDLLRKIVFAHSSNFRINNNDEINEKINYINKDMKNIFMDFTNYDMDDENYKKLSKIINLRKKVVQLIFMINFFNNIINLDISKLHLKKEIKNLIFVVKTDCELRLFDAEKDLDKCFNEIESLLDEYNSKELANNNEENDVDSYVDYLIYKTPCNNKCSYLSFNQFSTLKKATRSVRNTKK